jgi:serine/threonine-protein kinase
MFDIGEHEGEKFLTMELVDGEPLTRRIAVGPDGAGRPLPLDQVVDIIEQVCAGLSAAHQSGVIHCDLKPDNLLLAREGQATRVVITDFGIARGLGHAPAPKGKQRQFDGTPLYVSPEQADAGRIDARTDIYSLGVVLYELLTGTPPFTGSSVVAVVAARVLRPPPDLRQARPDLPAGVAQVVQRCLARQPAERFQLASELAAALRQAADAFLQQETRVLTAREMAAALPAAPPAAAADDPAVGTTGGQMLSPLPRAANQRVIAVLPLRNQGTPEDEYLADGLSQDLIDSLAAVPGVRVYSRGALARWLAQNTDPLLIGRALNAELIVEGAVRRSGDQLRVTVRVINVSEGFQVLAERFDCPASEILRISDSLSDKIAAVLKVEHERAERPMAAHPSSALRYLRARYLYGLGDQASIEESARLLEEILAEVQNEPTLLMASALTRTRLWFFGDQSSAELARAAAERVVAAVPHRGEAHLALAAVRYQSADLPEAVRAARRALALSPDLADAHDLLGRIYIETGPLRQGLQHLVHARNLDPGLSRTLVDQARTCALIGDYEQAHTLLADPLIEGRYVVPWITRARLCLWARDARRAQRYLEAMEKDQADYPRAYLLMRMAAAPASEGRVAPSEVLTEKIGRTTASPRGRAFFYQIHAEVFSAGQQTELAVRSVARCVDAGLSDLTWIDRCPPIRSLAADPRIGKLRRVVYERAMLVREVATET